MLPNIYETLPTHPKLSETHSVTANRESKTTTHPYVMKHISKLNNTPKCFRTYPNLFVTHLTIGYIYSVPEANTTCFSQPHKYTIAKYKMYIHNAGALSDPTIGKNFAIFFSICSFKEGNLWSYYWVTAIFKDV